MMVTILMATYNGATFLAEQLQSIQMQSYKDWVLIIRDDRSTDNTVSIIQRFAAADGRIKLLDLPGNHGSSVINFSVLFDYAYAQDARYVMFSDQDDIWKVNKIENSLAFIRNQETNAGDSTPLLMYGGVTYVDEQGTEIPKVLKMPAHLSLPMLLCENPAYGCTMIMNNALLKQVQHIPEYVENHDYYLALVACAFGQGVCNEEQLIFYRQHAANASGNVNRSSLSSRIFRYVQNVEHLLPTFTKNLNMVDKFYQQYGKEMGGGKAELVAGYLQAFRTSSVSLLLYMQKNKFKKQDLSKTLTHYYILSRLRSKVLILLGPKFGHTGITTL
jgi:rhamnosyltransferase